MVGTQSQDGCLTQKSVSYLPPTVQIYSLSGKEKVFRIDTEIKFRFA